MKQNEELLSRKFKIITAVFLIIAAIIFSLFDIRSCSSYVEVTPIPDNIRELGFEPINLNTATAEELMKVDGIGPATAEKIIAYREKFGSFLSVDELTEISGIGQNTLKKIKDRFTV